LEKQITENKTLNTIFFLKNPKMATPRFTENPIPKETILSSQRAFGSYWTLTTKEGDEKRALAHKHGFLPISEEVFQIEKIKHEAAREGKSKSKQTHMPKRAEDDDFEPERSNNSDEDSEGESASSYSSAESGDDEGGAKGMEIEEEKPSNDVLDLPQFEAEKSAVLGEESSKKKKDIGYLVALCGRCVHEKTNKKATLNVPFLFKSEESQENASGDGYDMLIDKFNDWLQTHGKKGWFLDDIIECYEKLSSADDPVVVKEDEEDEEAELERKKNQALEELKKSRAAKKPRKAKEKKKKKKKKQHRKKDEGGSKKRRVENEDDDDVVVITKEKKDPEPRSSSSKKDKEDSWTRDTRRKYLSSTSRFHMKSIADKLIDTKKLEISPFDYILNEKLSRADVKARVEEDVKKWTIYFSYYGLHARIERTPACEDPLGNSIQPNAYKKKKSTDSKYAFLGPNYPPNAMMTYYFLAKDLGLPHHSTILSEQEDDSEEEEEGEVGFNMFAD
jgi:hypothetical protein